jgi:drug/metabolite transporter (DMT)-like permease
MHLLLPLLASLLLVCGLILVKRAGEVATETGVTVGALTPLFLTNLLSSLVFSGLWALGGQWQSMSLVWQPAIIATLFMSGLIFTFLAIGRGDVSIATPVLGVKVLLVAALLTLFFGHQLSAKVWLAAVLAMIGIGVIQWTGRSQPKRVVMTIAFALAAASSFATFDVLVQRWSPTWGAGRFLPLTYWIVGILSLAMIPWVNFKVLKEPRVAKPLLCGALLIAVQAICITVAVAMFADAARINVVYTLRGLWGVLLAWAASRYWGGGESDLSRNVMITRVVGAALLTSAVVLVILSTK